MTLRKTPFTLKLQCKLTGWDVNKLKEFWSELPASKIQNLINGDEDFLGGGKPQRQYYELSQEWVAREMPDLTSVLTQHASEHVRIEYYLVRHSTGCKPQKPRAQFMCGARMQAACKATVPWFPVHFVVGMPHQKYLTQVGLYPTATAWEDPQWSKMKEPTLTERLRPGAILVMAPWLLHRHEYYYRVEFSLVGTLQAANSWYFSDCEPWVPDPEPKRADRYCSPKVPELNSVQDDATWVDPESLPILFLPLFFSSCSCFWLLFHCFLCVLISKA